MLVTCAATSGGFNATAGPRREILNFLALEERKRLRLEHVPDVALATVRRDVQPRLYRINGEAIRPLCERTGTFERLWGRQLSRVQERSQVPITRRFLERLPEDRLLWRPHQKSMSAGQLALHIARIPGGVVRFVQQNPAPAPDFGTVPQPGTLPEVLSTFEESVAAVKSLLPQWGDSGLQETWRMVQGDRELLVIPRGQFLRDIMLDHWYQHRGQFSVYLRLLDVAVPASWGPSADEVPGFLQKRQAA
jgi:uncharacterized damage-inducible protein DinB